MRYTSWDGPTITRRGVEMHVAHDLPKAKLKKSNGLWVRFRMHCEIATPERKTITQSVLLLQVSVHAVAVLPIRIW
jgi:hypothetical protein